MPPGLSSRAAASQTGLCISTSTCRLSLRTERRQGHPDKAHTLHGTCPASPVTCPYRLPPNSATMSSSRSTPVPRCAPRSTRTTPPASNSLRPPLLSASLSPGRGLWPAPSHCSSLQQAARPQVTGAAGPGDSASCCQARWGSGREGRSPWCAQLWNEKLQSLSRATQGRRLALRGSGLAQHLPTSVSSTDALLLRTPDILSTAGRVGRHQVQTPTPPGHSPRVQLTGGRPAGHRVVLAQVPPQHNLGRGQPGVVGCSQARQLLQAWPATVAGGAGHHLLVEG